MKLSEKMADFVHGPQSMVIGCRDEGLIPYGTRVLGALVGEDRETITFYVMEAQFERMRRNFENNGHVALSISNVLTLESYQFKGGYLSHRTSTEQDTAIQDIYADKFSAAIMQAGVPQSLAQHLVYKPCVAVTFQVEEVYDQTPAPGTGQKLSQEAN